jgi:hypothetical protein
MKRKIEKYLYGKNIDGVRRLKDHDDRYLIGDDIDGCLHAARHSAPTKKEQAATKTPNIRSRFEDKVEELKAYRAEHGHFKVKEKESKNLYEFCRSLRAARKTPDKSNRKLTADHIAQLDAIGFTWDNNMAAGGTVAPLPLATTIGVSSIAEQALQRLVSLGKTEEAMEFAKVEAKWGPSMASSAAALGKTTVSSLVEVAMKHSGNDPKVASLHKELGSGTFVDDRSSVDLPKKAICNKTFDDRFKELIAYKATHGHINVSLKATTFEEEGLYNFCQRMRRAREASKNRVLTAERIALLDSIGFSWVRENKKSEVSPPSKMFVDDRLSVGVPKEATHNTTFVRLSPPSKKSVDDLSSVVPKEATHNKTFEDRFEELKAYKAKHGKMNVTLEMKEEDGDLYNFCVSVKRARAEPEKGMLTAERIALLDSIGFRWEKERAKAKCAKVGCNVRICGGISAYHIPPYPKEPRQGTNYSLENASIQKLVRYHGRLLLHREVMERAGLTETGVSGKDHRRICSCHPIETVIKHASFTCKGSTYSQVYSLTVFSTSDSNVINPAVTESNTTVEVNPTDEVEHTSSFTDNEPSEDVSSPSELNTSSSVNQEPGEKNSGDKPKPNKKKRTFMVRTVGQTQKVIPSAIPGEPPVMVSSRSPKTIANLPKKKETEEAKAIRLARRRQRWKERQEKKRNNQSSMIFENQLQTGWQSQSHDNYDGTNNGEWLS